MGKSLFYHVFGTCLHGKRPAFHAVLIIARICGFLLLCFSHFICIFFFIVICVFGFKICLLYLIKMHF